jgi:hypothetical protein
MKGGLEITRRGQKLVNSPTQQPPRAYYAPHNFNATKQ